MNSQSKQIIISKGVRTLWRTWAAAACFLCATVLLGMLVYNIYHNPAKKIFVVAIKASIPIIFVFAMGVHYSRVRNLYFDLTNMEYKNENVVGPVKTGKWVTLPEIEYISVFRSKDGDDDGMTDTSGHNYEVKMWHHTSKHFTIYSSAEPEPALEMARYIATKLQVDLLDATVPNDSKWVELEKAAEEQTA